MTQWKTKNDYTKQFQKALDQVEQDRVCLTTYVDKQCDKLDKLIENISQENFWSVFPEILGVDARLTLLTELISYEDFSSKEIIRIIENDYKDYFKELCGYDLKVNDKPSMIFNIV
ncbi:DUF7006 family protein [Enterococcus sp. DIV0840c]|uniref:DUF7006 family protein n=1 Tax=Enterococcus sp. DIV0840c TaxID=2774772 RepID=UPI003D265F00